MKGEEDSDSSLDSREIRVFPLTGSLINTGEYFIELELQYNSIQPHGMTGKVTEATERQDSQSQGKSRKLGHERMTVALQVDTGSSALLVVGHENDTVEADEETQSRPPWEELLEPYPLCSAQDQADRETSVDQSPPESHSRGQSSSEGSCLFLINYGGKSKKYHVEVSGTVRQTTASLSYASLSPTNSAEMHAKGNMITTDTVAVYAVEKIVGAWKARGEGIFGLSFGTLNCNVRSTTSDPLGLQLHYQKVSCVPPPFEDEFQVFGLCLSDEGGKLFSGLTPPEPSAEEANAEKDSPALRKLARTSGTTNHTANKELFDNIFWLDLLPDYMVLKTLNIVDLFKRSYSYYKVSLTDIIVDSESIFKAAKEEGREEREEKEGSLLSENFELFPFLDNDVIIDSGTTLLLLSESYFASLKNYFQKHYCHLPLVCEDGYASNIFSEEETVCIEYLPDKFPTIFFVLNDRVKVSLPPSYYFLPFRGSREKRKTGKEVYCFGIQKNERNIFGDVFLRRYLTVFDKVGKRVGFTQNRESKGKEMHKQSSLSELFSCGHVELEEVFRSHGVGNDDEEVITLAQPSRTASELKNEKEAEMASKGTLVLTQFFLLLLFIAVVACCFRLQKWISGKETRRTELSEHRLLPQPSPLMTSEQRGGTEDLQGMVRSVSGPLLSSSSSLAAVIQQRENELCFMRESHLVDLQKKLEETEREKEAMTKALKKCKKEVAEKSRVINECVEELRASKQVTREFELLLKTRKQERERIEEELRESQQVMGQERERASALEREIQMKAEEMKTVLRSRKVLEKEVRLVNLEADDVTLELEQRLKGMEELQKKVENMELKRQALKKKMKETERKHAQKMNTAVQAQERERKLMSEQLSLADEQKLKLKAKNERLQKEKEDLERAMVKEDRRSELLQRQVQIASDTCVKLEQKLSTQEKTVEEYLSRLEHLSTQNGELKGAEDCLREDSEKLSDQYALLATSLEALKQDSDNAYRSATVEVRGLFQEKILCLESEIKSVEQKLEAAREENKSLRCAQPEVLHQRGLMPRPCNDLEVVRLELAKEKQASGTLSLGLRTARAREKQLLDKYQKLKRAAHVLKKEKTVLWSDNKDLHKQVTTLQTTSQSSEQPVSKRKEMQCGRCSEKERLILLLQQQLVDQSTRSLHKLSSDQQLFGTNLPQPTTDLVASQKNGGRQRKQLKPDLFCSISPLTSLDTNLQQQVESNLQTLVLETRPSVKQPTTTQSHANPINTINEEITNSLQEKNDQLLKLQQALEACHCEKKIVQRRFKKQATRLLRCLSKLEAQNQMLRCKCGLSQRQTVRSYPIQAAENNYLQSSCTSGEDSDSETTESSSIDRGDRTKRGVSRGGRKQKRLHASTDTRQRKLMQTQKQLSFSVTGSALPIELHHYRPK